MSLPYFKQYHWEAEVVTVDLSGTDSVIEPLMLESVPSDTIIHYIKALPKKWTARFGLGSLAIRSLWQYKKQVDRILFQSKFDLIYFSTTQFPVCILGNFWKKKHNIPYVIDMQDPWHTEFYKDKPRNQRPKKYWLSYRLNKYLEPIAMSKVDGIISVSEGYIKDLTNRYPRIAKLPSATITFGALIKDVEIANQAEMSVVLKPKPSVNILYIGRGGYDMLPAITLLLKSYRSCLDESPEIFSQYHFYFMGTSYAPTGQGKKTTSKLVSDNNLSDYVTEISDRQPFYSALKLLGKADILFIPGTLDPQYTASKIYPYLLSEKPLLSMFHPHSSAFKIIEELRAGLCLSMLEQEDKNILQIKHFLKNFSEYSYKLDYNLFNKHSAETMTKRQCELFDRVIKAYNINLS
jgi:hypothetical protein